ncbi:hypothetical protein HGRIS_004057 [Hohenbuehelia grisea]|uniref:VASt domain-containing protein n=1 Tax=Hohenbuehelia grisea TaxID=104357 RepID=A0ABR3JHB4_9AGAR
MAPIYSFSPKTTSISYPWPTELTGLERIMLSAQGDLQRTLSAFFDTPLTVTTTYSHTFTHVSPGLPAVPLNLPNAPALAAASAATPIVQTRQVLLQCLGTTACTATSAVRIMSPRAAHLFLEEKYAIGQMFRKLEMLPAFELLEVGFGNAPAAPSSTLSSANHDEHAHGDAKERYADRSKQVWRIYKLSVPEFECEILEVFPSRDMFVYGKDWLLGKRLPVERYTHRPELRSQNSEAEMAVKLALTAPRWQGGLAVVFGFAFLLMFALQVLILFSARSQVCASL